MDDESGRPGIIVLAYACSPKGGSEHGAGWGVVTALMEFCDVTVITGSRHMDEIDEWTRDHPHSPARFVEVSDRRAGPMFRWHRIPEVLHYLAWLHKARKRAQELVAEHHYDVAVHATFSAVWLPTPMVHLGIPSVWGPVGGGVITPRPLRRLLGLAGSAQELLDYASVRVMSALRPVRKTATAATQRLLQNEESRALLPQAVRANSRIFNHALLTVVPDFPTEDDGRYVLWASPMESRKGPQLALEAIAETREDIRLIMVGDGPQRSNLEQSAATLGIAARVEFTGRIPREQVVSLMRGATTVVLTGLREEGGLTLAEAMYTARRLVVLDIGGAGAVARNANDPQPRFPDSARRHTHCHHPAGFSYRKPLRGSPGRSGSIDRS